MEGENEKPTVKKKKKYNFWELYWTSAFTVYLSVLDSNSCWEEGEHGELGLWIAS